MRILPQILHKLSSSKSRRMGLGDQLMPEVACQFSEFCSQSRTSRSCICTAVHKLLLLGKQSGVHVFQGIAYVIML
jgi:hypothetical protein